MTGLLEEEFLRMGVPLTTPFCFSKYPVGYNLTSIEKRCSSMTDCLEAQANAEEGDITDGPLVTIKCIPGEMASGSVLWAPPGILHLLLFVLVLLAAMQP